MSDTPRTDAADLYDYQTAIEVCGQLERELAVARKGLEAVESLMNESHGVGGLHLNGDFAPWRELRTGGRFEEWRSLGRLARGLGCGPCRLGDGLCRLYLLRRGGCRARLRGDALLRGGLFGRRFLGGSLASCH